MQQQHRELLLVHITRHHCVHLPLSAKMLTSLPSTQSLTRVSGPIQCAVGPSANSEEAWCVVATHTLTSVGGFTGQVPFPVDPPLWSLNAPYAKHGRPPDEGNLLQSDQLLYTQSNGTPSTGSGSSPGSF